MRPFLVPRFQRVCGHRVVSALSPSMRLLLLDARSLPRRPNVSSHAWIVAFSSHVVSVRIVALPFRLCGHTRVVWTWATLLELHYLRNRDGFKTIARSWRTTGLMALWAAVPLLWSACGPSRVHAECALLVGVRAHSICTLQ